MYTENNRVRIWDFGFGIGFLFDVRNFCRFGFCLVLETLADLVSYVFGNLEAEDVEIEHRRWRLETPEVEPYNAGVFFPNYFVV